MNEPLARLDNQDLYDLRRSKATLYAISMKPEAFNRTEIIDAHIDDDILLSKIVEKYGVINMEDCHVSTTTGEIREYRGG